MKRKAKMIILAVAIIPLLFVAGFSEYWCDTKDAMIVKLEKLQNK